MHSRIIELSKDPILKHERMCESSVPDWFYHSIADYTDADTDRDHDIKWFLDAVARVVDVAEDGKSFTFKPKAKQKYFERQYHAFLDKACELTGISLDALEMAMQTYDQIKAVVVVPHLAVMTISRGSLVRVAEPVVGLSILPFPDRVVLVVEKEVA